MNNFLHIDLPCGDADIAEIEKALGVKFQKVYSEMVPTERVEVCPMSSPTGEVGFMEIKGYNPFEKNLI